MVLSSSLHWWGLFSLQLQPLIHTPCVSPRPPQVSEATSTDSQKAHFRVLYTGGRRRKGEGSWGFCSVGGGLEWGYACLTLLNKDTTVKEGQKWRGNWSLGGSIPTQCKCGSHTELWYGPTTPKVHLFWVLRTHFPCIHYPAGECRKNYSWDFPLIPSCLHPRWTSCSLRYTLTDVHSRSSLAPTAQ